MSGKRWWTLVRHSAWTVQRDPGFERAVEDARLESADQAAAVLAVGGVVLQEWPAACDAMFAANYPSGHFGLLPAARGGFAPVGGLDVFVPQAGGR